MLENELIENIYKEIEYEAKYFAKNYKFWMLMDLSVIANATESIEAGSNDFIIREIIFGIDGVIIPENPFEVREFWEYANFRFSNRWGNKIIWCNGIGYEIEFKLDNFLP